MKPLRIQIFSLCFLMLGAFQSSTSPASEPVTEELLRKAQLVFEEARVLMSRANLEKDPETRLTIFQKISQNSEFNTIIEEMPVPIADAILRARTDAYNRLSRWTRNIFTFASLQVEAPECFANLSNFCLLQLLVQKSYGDSEQRAGKRYPRFTDVAIELAKSGNDETILDKVTTLEPAQTPWFDAFYAVILFQKNNPKAPYFLNRAIERVDQMWPPDRPFVLSQIAQAHMIAGKPQLAVGAIKKAIEIAENLKSKQSAAYRMASVAEATVRHDIGNTSFKLSVLRTARKAIDRISRTYRFISDREFSRTVGSFVGTRMAADTLGVGDAIALIKNLVPERSFDPWAQFFKTLISSNNASRVESLLANPPKEMVRFRQEEHFVVALAKINKFDEAFALIPQLRNQSDRVNAYFRIFTIQLIQKKDVKAARQTMRRLDSFLPPLSATTKRFPEGHTLTRWKGATTGERALADIRRAEMLALLGEHTNGSEALIRALKWLLHGSKNKSSRAITYAPRGFWLSPLQSAWISVSKSLQPTQNSILFETARKAGAFMQLQIQPGSLSLGGVLRPAYFRQIAAIMVLLGHSHEANTAISELVFSKHDLMDDLYGLLHSINFIAPRVASYPHEP